MPNEVTINISGKLELLQSSVNEVRKVLDSLQPNSKGFKELEKIIQKMEGQMKNLEVQTNRTFSSNQQFARAGKSIDNIEESLIAAGLAIKNLKFDDIKLSGKAAEDFESLKNQISSASEELNKLKRTTFFDNLGEDAANALKSIDTNYMLKDLDAIEKEISGKLKSINKEVESAREKYNTAQQNAATQKNWSALTQKYDATKPLNQEADLKKLMQNLGFKDFDPSEFLMKDAEGNFTKFRNGMRKKFLEMLSEAFSITPDAMNKIAGDLSGKDLQQLFNNILKNIPDKIDVSGAETQESTAKQVLQKAEAKQQAVAQVEAAILTNDDAVKQTDAYKQLEERLNAVVAELEKFKQAQEDAAHSSGDNLAKNEQYSRALKGMRDELQQTNTQFLKFQNAQRTFQNIKMAITNFMGFYQVLNLVKKAVTDAMNHIKQLDATMNAIAVVSGQTTAELWKQVDVYTEIAQKYGTTIQGAYEVSKIYYQAGYQTNEVLTLMNETLKLSKISGIDYAQTTDYMMTAIRGFHLEVEEASHVVDVYSALAAHTAISQAELAEAITRTASSMEGVGATFEQTSAMIATTVAATRESASNIGSAMKSIASRYGELKTDPSKLIDSEGEALSFNKVDTALRSVGISMRTVDGQFRNFADVILELSDIWDTLDSTSQRYIATVMAGNRPICWRMPRAA